MALSYDSSTRALRHWVDGKLQDFVTLTGELEALHPTGENILSIGKRVDGSQPWRGLMDEVRISAALPYGDEFTPRSLAPEQIPIALDLGPHIFMDDYLVANTTNLFRMAQHPELRVAKPEGWDEFAKNRLHIVLDTGPDAPNPDCRYMQYQYNLSLSAVKPGGISVSYAPTRAGPWTAYEKNPIIPYIWAGQPGTVDSVSDISGQAIEGYAFEDCSPITGDNVKHTVTWKGVKGIASLANDDREISIEFLLDHGSLFAFYLE